MGINIEKEYIQRVANTNILRIVGVRFSLFSSLLTLKYKNIYLSTVTINNMKTIRDGWGGSTGHGRQQAINSN